MRSPYERTRAVFTPEMVQKLHEDNRADRFRRYPELQAMEELLTRLNAPKVERQRKSR